MLKPIDKGYSVTREAQDEKNNINVLLKGKRTASRSRIEPLMCRAHVSWVKKALLLEPRAGRETKVRPSTAAVLIDLIV